jgi:putative phosphoribosyl transferase
MQLPFADRSAAGRELARKLREIEPMPDSIVLGLARGGVPVAFEVAADLHLELDVFVVRKLGVPGHPELAMGAIASGGVRVLNEDLIHDLGIPQAAIEQVATRESEELRRREADYRDGRPPADLQDCSVILVDDGLATGASMRSAVEAVRKLGATPVTVAVPVAAKEACGEFAHLVDAVVCAATPEPFFAVGPWYRDFSATSDREVRALLARAREEQFAPVLRDRR